MFRKLTSLILIVIFSVWFGDYLNTANFEAVKLPSIKKTVLATTPLKPGYFQVTKVVDGDTIEVSIDGVNEKIRLIGVDTPETVDPRKPVQCLGKEASNYSKSVLEGKSVKLEADETQENRDRYKRLLRYAILDDGTNFNELLIEKGFAHEYTYDTPYKYQSEFKSAEEQARLNSIGLWSVDTCNGQK